MIQNKLSEYKTFTEKENAYYRACTNSANHVMAYYPDGSKTPLSNIDVSRVEYIGGLWRVQVSFPYKIQHVRNRDFVLSERLPRQEKNHFEFYRAQMVGYNCYGPFLIPNASRIVAKYDTNRGTFWAYGDTIEQARAFLGIKLYEEYQDLIHSVSQVMQDTKQKK
ncbi:MAG: hypothetical protein IJY99_04770 [Alphaproteobacteria bacterium]|nr:hypothetical protein [Alphaproteobacteria bacterium]